MTASPTSVAVIGSTGLVGSNILSTLLAAEKAYNPIHTITRRAPKVGGSASSPPPAALNAVVDGDTSKWATLLSGSGGLTPAPSTVFSALGTTRAAAGGVENQWKIDHDLNVELARAAREGGATSCFVFISSAGTRGLASSWAPYSRMKNGVEDAIRHLDFDHAVILKPGVILGQREESRTAESLFQSAVRGLGRVSQAGQDKFGHEAVVIARAAVRAAELAREGKAPSKYWVVEGDEIIRLGRTEWPPAVAAADETTTTSTSQ